MKKLTTILATLLTSTLIHAQEFQSEATASVVIEMFTSEGCSSCVPADKWMGTLTEHPALFSSIVPMAFHVDYWDYIGWIDPLAKREYSQRQRAYQTTGAIHSVYTPGFVANGKEWRDWFFDRSAIPEQPQATPGVLRGTLADETLTVTFDTTEPLQLNMAYLGMGLSNDITAGENRNLTLHHDFVVLKHWRSRQSDLTDNTRTWVASLPEIPQASQQRTALVIWLAERGSDAPIQATGTYID
ncbi:DUF1223 domain-containing protein [Reinekea marinisedimentorum]|uniref:DUF1223 domain-containing protein n=1 Tax=Reinekea marinisedimentorum TaxID=230495 RepID=A0A4R3IAW7_9GAMM|nr:DUF1223 domain-containing protein [Reinekea marinisedimentorum]TCS41577.1 hypothetical protein BCF53_1051 [Reinekea marinisedimentorum]